MPTVSTTKRCYNIDTGEVYCERADTKHSELAALTAANVQHEVVPRDIPSSLWILLKRRSERERSGRRKSPLA